MRADSNSQFLMPNNHPITIFFIWGVGGRKSLVIVGVYGIVFWFWFIFFFLLEFVLVCFDLIQKWYRQTNRTKRLTFCVLSQCLFLAPQKSWMCVQVCACLLHCSSHKTVSRLISKRSMNINSNITKNCPNNQV